MMKKERKTAYAALRRGMVLLCTFVLTLMAVTLSAAAAEVSGLTVQNIGLSEDGCLAGTKPTQTVIEETAGRTSFWKAEGTEISGTVTPADYKIKIGRKYYQQCESSASSSLTITNESGDTCLLTFSYTPPKNGGTLTFSPGSEVNDGTYRATLAPNASVTVTLTTNKNTTYKTDSTQSDYTTTTRLSDIKLASVNTNISVTLEKPTNGSYTATVGNESFEIGQTQTLSRPVSTFYVLRATAADGYFFDGWYVNKVLTSREPEFKTAFTANSHVEARFVDDPLLNVIQMSAPGMAKSDYIAVNSSYYHGYDNANRSMYTTTGPEKKDDAYTKNAVSDPQWSIKGSGITSSASGTAQGDWQQSSAGNSTASANLYSDVIRIYCKESCTISFEWEMEATPKDTARFAQLTDEEKARSGAFLFYYTSKSANVAPATIINEDYGKALTKVKTKANGQATLTVNEGDYLYLSAYGKTMYRELRSGLDRRKYAETKYNYSATISNVIVTPNITKHTITIQNTDNMGNALAGGTVLINGASTSVSKPYIAEKAEGSTLTLKSYTAPTGYAFIGWYNSASQTYDYTHDTYTVTVTEDCEINPIYVPVMTITTGGDNGYESATYQYKNLSGKTATSTNLYVARGPIPSNGENPAFYTSLKDAFDATNTVFLLAGDIINGDLTIPAPKTLVIPDRVADPGPESDKPEQSESTVGISSYCKVTYDGKLTVSGKLVVNAKQSGAANGRATGGIGYLNLSDNATITVEKGGELCGYGLIRGGSITAKDGSTVRELLEVSDRRGADITKTIYLDKNRVFLFNNYSVKTIESRATYDKGATLFAQYSVTLEGNNKSAGAVRLFASSDALFNLSQGSMTKYFDRQTDKTVYRLNESSKMDTGYFKLSLSLPIIGALTIDTSNFWLPLNAGFDIRTAGDMTLNGDFKFLPGASLSVEKGGTCTVAKGKSLIFYRLNDYDTREIGNDVYQKGYSTKAYPVNATGLPGGGYMHPTLNTVGSARLNVDGKMIVDGGLYVSDELVSQSNQGYGGMESGKTRQQINADYFTLYPNGYNVLTGTGTIKMTTALKEGTAHEAMTAKDTKDVVFAPIKITPIAGLKVDATEDTPKNYQPLNKATTYYGVYHLGGFYTWTTVKPQIAKIVNGANEQTYRSLAAAVAAYDGTNGYIQMIENSTEPGFTLDRNVTLDLNGKTVKLVGGLTVEEGKTLYGMDSSTGKSYAVAPSGKIVGKVTGTVAPVFEKPLTGDAEYNYLRYVAIKNDAGTEYTFHRFNISVTGYRFELATGDTPQCALFFIGKFRGDDAAKKYLTKLGFTLKYIADESQDFSYPMPESLNNEVGLDEEGAYLFEAYLMRSFDKNNAAAYQTKISATAQAIFGTNVGTQNSETKEWSFQDAWLNALTDSDMDISPAEKEILEKFLKDLNIPIPNPNPKTE